jgi:conjugal transfer/type IV secretion protein DotA/TraY
MKSRIMSTFALFSISIIATLIPDVAIAAEAWTMEEDYSFKSLRYIFGDIVNVLTGEPTPDRPDSMLGAISEVYNSAMMTLTFIIFSYNGLSGLFSSAEQGVFLGKNVSSTFAPLRTAMSFAFIVPFKAGYSAMQIFVLMVAGQGINLGSAMSTAAIDYIETTGSLYPPPYIIDVDEMAKNLLISNICQLAVNRLTDHNNIIKVSEMDDVWFENIHYSDGINEEISDDEGIGKVPKRSWYLRFDSKYSFYSVETWGLFGSAESFGNNACGSLEVKFPTIQSDSPSFPPFQVFSDKYIEQVKELDYAMATLAVDIMRADVEEDVVPVNPSAVIDAVSNFKTEHMKNIRIFSEDIMKYRKQEWDEGEGDAPNVLGEGVRQAGWMALFSFYWDFITLNKETHYIINSAPYYTSPNTEVMEVEGINSTVGLLDKYLKTMDQKLGNGVIVNAEKVEKLQNGDEWNTLTGEYQLMNVYAEILLNHPDPIIAISTYAQNLLGFYQVLIISKIKLELQLKVVNDTLEAVSSTGQSAGIFGIKAVAVSKAMQIVSNLAINTLSWLLKLLIASFFILLPFLLLLAYYIPLIPFIYGMYGALGWMVLVLESMAAAPLWAAGHAFTEGEGFVGQRAQQGYMIILNVFTRPALMVFGFFASMMLLIPISKLLYTLFGPAIMSISGDSLFSIIFETIAYIGILTVLYFQLCSRCFKVIIDIPNNVSKFIGGSDQQLGEIDGADKVSTVVAGKFGSSPSNKEALELSKGAVDDVAGNDKDKGGDSNGSKAGGPKKSPTKSEKDAL